MYFRIVRSRSLIQFAVLVLVPAVVAAWPAAALGQITIGEDAGPASPYPSTVQVPPEARVIEDVDVVLAGLAHDFPDELDIALTGPGDRTLMLMSDSGDSGGCGTPPNVRFSAQATEQVPESALPCSGTYKPTDRDSDLDSDLFAAPAPAEPFGASLNDFTGSMMGGAWSIRVMDDTFSDGGSIADWWLRFDTRLAGQVRLAGSSLIVPETQPVAVLEVTRSGGSAAAPLGNATASWAISSQECGYYAPAAAGQDLAPATGSVSFGPGETRQVLALAPRDDRVPEPTECARIVLTSTSGDAALPRIEAVQVVLRDDDEPARPPAIAERLPQRVLRARAVRVRATSVADGTLAATGRIAVPGGAAAVVRLKRMRPVAAVADRPVTLSLRLSRKARRAVRRAFERRRRLVATVRVTATDLAGGTAGRTVRVKLRR